MRDEGKTGPDYAQDENFADFTTLTNIDKSSLVPADSGSI